ncbi:MAG: efflux RND transporter periplasmic adaptor subunit [Gammaproteobacteria bacterium]|nr:MAG: efflux RND transporter periplasmic adaptor subunit [Gammaproteobacteria bacterium]
MRKVVIGVLVVALVLSGYWYFTRSEPVSVYLVPVEAGLVEATVANTRAGTVKACLRSRLSMPIGGQVADLLVDEGDHVVAGQVLLRLWNEDRAAGVAEARARLVVSREASKESCDAAALDARELHRQKKLAEKKLISVEKLDAVQTRSNVSSFACTRAKASINTAQAVLKLQSALYDKTLLKAPFSGVVAEINGEVGEYITPSPPGVATPPAIDLIGSDCLYISAPIDEVDAADIRLGMLANVTLDAFRGRVFKGTVVRIAPYVKEFEKQARTVDIDVTFAEMPEDITLLVGYSADIEIILEQHANVLRIPTEVVIDNDKVLRYDPASGYLEKVTITPGLSNWTYTEVKNGLGKGDAVLLSLDTEGAVEGALVTPVQTSSGGASDGKPGSTLDGTLDGTPDGPLDAILDETP